MRYFIYPKIVEDITTYVLKKQKQLTGVDRWSDMEVEVEFDDPEKCVDYANEHNMFPLAIDLEVNNG